MALRDGILRNNVGVDRIVVALKARVADGSATANATGQSWALVGAPAPLPSDPWIWAEVTDLDATPQLRWLGASPGPTVRPPALPAPGGAR